MIKKKSIPWDRIPMIAAEKGMARKRTDTWFRSKNIKPNIYAQVSGNESILAMVSLGFGIGIVPQLVLEKNIINRDVQVLDIRPEIKPYSEK
jgi:LysR family positive regulator for ilvC